MVNIPKADGKDASGKAAQLESILVVNKDMHTIEDITRAIEDSELKCNILKCCNGDDAIVMYSKYSPKLIIIDTSLPKKSGFLVVEKIKEGKENPYIIMTSESPGKRNQEWARMKGVEAYFKKPFNMRKLMECIKHYVER